MIMAFERPSRLDREIFQRLSPQARLVGDAPAEPDWVEPQRIIYDHELVFFQGGEIDVEINQERFVCGDGSFIIIPPGVWHVSRVARGSRAHRYWVHFDWVVSPVKDSPVMTLYPDRPRKDLLRPPPKWMPKGIFHGRSTRFGHVRALHARLLSAATHGDPKVRLLCQGILFELLVELLFADGASRDRSVEEDRIACRIRDELEKLSTYALRECPLLTDHLAGFGVTYEHATRLFRRRFGTTPLDYISAMRIERAKRLLVETALPIGEVAVRVGYENHTYFARRFLATVGFSPTDYRSRNHPRP
jgi:AraC-like DNA-binding protein